MANEPRRQFELRLVAGLYAAGIGALRQAVADRSAALSEIVVSDETGSQISLFMRHSDLYVVGLELGSGRYRFLDQPGLADARPLEFGGSYDGLGLKTIKDDRVNAGRLTSAVRRLAKHSPGANGSNLHAHDRQSIGLLIVAVAEAMRLGTIEDAINEVLTSPGLSIPLRRFFGPSDEINNWDTYSRGSDWTAYGIKVRHKA